MKVEKNVGGISLYDLEGTFDEVISNLESEKMFYNASYPGVDYIKLCVIHGEYDGVPDCLGVSVVRDETPDEIRIRQAKTQKYSEYRRQQYEQLKKEFGDL